MPTHIRLRRKTLNIGENIYKIDGKVKTTTYCYCTAPGCPVRIVATPDLLRGTGGPYNHPSGEPPAQ